MRRNNYTTPTSFLGLISFYKRLLGSKQGAIITKIENLEQGLDTMEKVGAQVEGLKQQIEVAMADVAVEVKSTDALIVVVNKESADAAIEQAKANEQAAETQICVDAAEALLASADKELAAAIPAMESATAAAGNLTKDSLSIVKTLGTPHDHVKVVGKTAIILLKNEYKKTDWPNFVKMLGDPNKFR